MFTSPRYITAGIAETVPPALQHVLWYLIETMPVANKDYLQVFELSRCSKDGVQKQRIIHRQEEPAYHKEYEFKSNRTVEQKIFVIEDKSHCTMLLAEEY